MYRIRQQKTRNEYMGGKKEIGHRWPKQPAAKELENMGRSLCSPPDSGHHFTPSLAVQLGQSVQGEGSQHILCWNGGRSDLPQQQPLVHFLFSFLLQHRGLPEHCKVGKEKSLLKTAQSFVAELMFPGLGALGTCWHEGNGDNTWAESCISQAVALPQCTLRGWHPAPPSEIPILSRLLFSSHCHLTSAISGVHVAARATMAAKKSQIIVENETENVWFLPSFCPDESGNSSQRAWLWGGNRNH